MSARGYDLPLDFSVMGFDDISYASFVTPSLTTMKQPRLQIGEASMDLLLAMLEGEEVKKREILLRSDLILRNSVAIRRARSWRVGLACPNKPGNDGGNENWETMPDTPLVFARFIRAIQPSQLSSRR